jgi:hypothetical protein
MMKLSSFAVIEVSSIVMLSSQATKLSSWAAAELIAMVAATELTAVVVVVAERTAVMVEAT